MTFWLGDAMVDRYVMRVLRKLGSAHGTVIQEAVHTLLKADKRIFEGQIAPDAEVIYAALQKLSAKGYIEKFAVSGETHPTRYRARLYPNAGDL